MTCRKYISHNIFIRTYNNHITILSIQPVFYPIANTAQPNNRKFSHIAVLQQRMMVSLCECHGPNDAAHSMPCIDASDGWRARTSFGMHQCTWCARVHRVGGGCVRARIGCSCESALRSRSRLATLEHLGTTKAIFKRAVKWIKVMMVAHHRNRTIRSNRFHTAYAVCLFVFN